MGSYIRVIPRDLFNEGSLLKCLGRLSIELDNHQGHWASFDVADDSVSHFEIEQDPSDGSIEVTNLPFAIAGTRYRLFRPLNSRREYPLYCINTELMDVEAVAVFNMTGGLSRAMKDLLGIPQREEAA